jgi:glucose/arabinose dehydrogenase
MYGANISRLTECAWASFRRKASRGIQPIVAVFLACIVGQDSTQSVQAQVPFQIQGPGVDPADFRITTFATGLNFPVGMAALPDGSLLVATTDQTFFASDSGSLVRLADTDGDGVADEQTTLFDSVAGGSLTSVQVAGELVLVNGQHSPISIFRMGATPADPLSQVGSIEFTYSGPTLADWIHPNTALLVRGIPDQPGAYDVYFQIGSDSNSTETTFLVPVQSDVGLSHPGLPPQSLFRMRLVDDGTSVGASNIEQLAEGLRNASGFGFHPATGDLYLVDNGMDQPGNDFDQPLSADELNVIARDALGQSVIDFGFPDNYVEHGSGEIVGGGGVEPLVAFQPLSTGDAAGGPNQMVFAPKVFPESLRNGIFVGMHGIFHSAGAANHENPLVFVDLDDHSFFHFIGIGSPGVGHLDGLLATDDSLFISDISPTGSFTGSQLGTGVIYQIRAVSRTLSGDYNGSGQVEQADLDLVLLHWGADAATPPAGWTIDLPEGAIDQDELDRVLLNWGRGPADPSYASAVPEPSTLLIVLTILFVVPLVSDWAFRIRHQAIKDRSDRRAIGSS